MQIQFMRTLGRKLEEKSVELAREVLMNNLVIDGKCVNMSVCEEDMPKIRKPLFQQVQEEFMAELIERACELHIPYNKDDWSWYDLRDVVSEYEALLEEAKQYHIDWDISEYDPIALQQEIEYCQRQAFEEKSQFFSYFYATREC